MLVANVLAERFYVAIVKSITHLVPRELGGSD